MFLKYYKQITDAVGQLWSMLSHSCRLTGAAAHLNHQPMPGLGGRTPCEVLYSGRPRATLTVRQRKEVTDQLIIIVGEVLQDMDYRQPRMALEAWRLAFERWLLMNNHISVAQNEVSPSFRTSGIS